MVIATRRATSLRPGQLKHLIRVASVTGRMPERDVFLLWYEAHTTGIRVTELALLEVADVLYPSGAIKPEVDEAEICKGCNPRNVYLTHAKCLAALDAWLVVRSERRWGLSGADEYRGLRPDSKLVMSHKGRHLNWRSSTACSIPAQRHTALATACNRRSAGSIAKRASSKGRHTAAGERLPQKCWQQPAMWRLFRRSWATRNSTTPNLT